MRRDPADAARHRWALVGVVGVQAICAVYLASGILGSLLGIPLPPLPWALHEYLEIAAALGMIAGVAFGALLLHRSQEGRKAAEARLSRMRGEFRSHMEARFARWGLTPAEAEVAVLAIKGLRTQEIAALRETSEGTVKAQTNAIYRKARVTGRTQLLSLFIEDLFAEEAAAEVTLTERRIVRAA
ncbi:MAG: response regulator transcription factor [Rhodobacteraceae bacterium]|nr:response regulator transcription factor [Paracoccaceae bacterium]